MMTVMMRMTMMSAAMMKTLTITTMLALSPA